MLVFGNPIASRGVSSPAVAVSVTLATMIVMPTIRIFLLHFESFPCCPDFRAHDRVDFGEFHCESRGHLARCGGLCRLCEDGCDAHYWSVVATL